MSNLKYQFLVFASLLSLAAPALADEPGMPRLLDVTPTRVFAPPGFDSNDNAQLVLAGEFPNTCFRMGPAEARVDVERKRIFVRSRAYYYPQGWCLQTLVPFDQTVELGVLPAGEYSVHVEGERDLRVKMPVALSVSGGPDDFLYALVDEGRTEVVSEEGQQELIVAGKLTSSCMFIKELRTMYRARNVVEVLPIAEVRPNTICQPVLRPFEARVLLRRPWDGDTLVHIRSLNGKAVNRVVQL
jgi:hypothetical protein